MIANKLFKRLDKDFDLEHLKDDWSGMDFNEFISTNFKKTYMGILVDNSEEIKTVYTAVFPSDKVLKEIMKKGEENVLLFTHHPMTWDIRKAPEIFSNINTRILKELKEKRISIYTLHTPLDKNGEYSTTVNLAKVLNITLEVEICEYFGVKVGIIGTTELKKPEPLIKSITSVVGHNVRFWKYGTNEIKNGRVALTAGGGNEVFVLEEIAERGVNTYVTGITLLNDYSKKAHNFAKQNKINIIGATHYSTEKFACIAMCNYFEDLGLPCKFIEDDPVLEDL
ncbi:MAG: Nif3-like dinuclear metal center hexameric protein [Candidatus Hodarchaeales archaeon]|jgi:putative NIF3 family GTP cyclohydrolase 1 type 2